MQGKSAQFTISLVVFSAIFAISTSSILIRFAQEEGVPSIVIAALRLTFATVLLMPVALTRHLEEMKSFSFKTIGQGVAAGCFLAVHFATWIASLEFTAVASSAIFVSTGPFWVALLSPLFLNERLSSQAIWGLILSFAGGVLIWFSEVCTWNGGLMCGEFINSLRGGTVRGNFLALAGAWAITGYLIIGRRARRGISLFPYIFMVYGVAAFVLVFLMLFSGKSPFGYAPMTYVWLLMLAILPQLIGHSTLNWALKFLPATFIAVITLAEPVGSAILAAVILQEIPSASVIIGGIVILSGIYVISKQIQ